jgi:hypothetical protein
VEYLELRDNKPNILAIVFASNFPKNPIYDKYPIDITIDSLKGFDLVNGILIFDEEVIVIVATPVKRRQGVGWIQS